jgi:hypothetical protein
MYFEPGFTTVSDLIQRIDESEEATKTNWRVPSDHVLKTVAPLRSTSTRLCSGHYMFDDGPWNRQPLVDARLVFTPNTLDKKAFVYRHTDFVLTRRIDSLAVEYDDEYVDSIGAWPYPGDPCSFCQQLFPVSDPAPSSAHADVNDDEHEVVDSDSIANRRQLLLCGHSYHARCAQALSAARDGRDDDAGRCVRCHEDLRALEAALEWESQGQTLTMHVGAAAASELFKLAVYQSIYHYVRFQCRFRNGARMSRDDDLDGSAAAADNDE